MRSTARFHLALARAAVAVNLAARATAAQEGLDDQDPVDLDWVPAWDTPFWPAPTGAALEIAAGRTGIPTAPGAGGTERAQAGDYVLALLTLPLGARGSARASNADVEADGEAWTGEGAEELPASGRGGRIRPGDPGADASGGAPPRASASAPSPPAPARAGGASDASPLGPASASSVGGPSGRPAPEAAMPLPAPDPAPRRTPRPTEVPLELLRAALDRAEHAAGLNASMRRLSTLGQRSRWSGLSPELRLRGATGIDQTRSTDSAGVVPGEETLRDASDSLVEVRLTFHLERLLYSGQEVALERARQQLLADRVELHATVARELLSYRRALRRLDEEELLDEDRAEAEFDAERARLTLFLLTDGWFRGRETVRRYEVHAD